MRDEGHAVVRSVRFFRSRPVRQVKPNHSCELEGVHHVKCL